MPFNSVLTLCSKCKKSITVIGVEYKDRNKDYKCRKCSALYFKGFKATWFLSPDRRKRDG